MKKRIKYVFLFFLCALCGSCQSKKEDQAKTDPAPRIINIINFIRKTDYRLNDSERLLFETVQEQIKLVKHYDFPATFLFQYDALITKEYQELMKNELPPKCEIGAWWEITQPHVEAAGIPWRGEHSWVSTANIAFTTGYTCEEREKLVDVYMDRFKGIFGYYPKSVGSWFIDSHTLAYLYEKYGIVASCNCKDQVGTDGYTLWGGYWNQAYYPSRKNAYMPAQTEEGQIPVPIFRMLGSDPLYQYDTGLGQSSQGVISLEPVYTSAGKDRKWVDYFLKSIVDEPCLAFNYAQAGQENSFTWSAMKDGLEMQFPLFDSLRKEGKIVVETLESSGQWFRNKFPTTPATAVTTLTDVNEAGNKGVWYNSRYYRANLFWSADGFRFRDIHLFDESLESSYLTTPGTGHQFLYYTLPVIDGYFWSTSQELSGLKFVRMDKNGNKEEIALQNPVVTELTASVLEVKCTDKNGHIFTITLYEDRIDIKCKENDLKWILELKVPKSRLDALPFQTYNESSIQAVFRGHSYTIECKTGKINRGNSDDFIFQLIPVKGKLSINCFLSKNK